MKAKNPNRNSGRETAATYEYYTGVDVSKGRPDVFIPDRDGEPVQDGKKQFRNDPAGIKKLIRHIPPGSLTVMESTGIYHV